jgi:hypothetical protein
MTINWPTVGHATVGIIIAVAQAVAMADPTPQVVNICHVVAIVAAQVGASLGVWTVSQFVAAKRLAAVTPCGHCGKAPANDTDPEPKKEPKAEPEKAA